MAYNELLADRVREILSAASDNITEKQMFGGLCFMVNDKICVGVKTDKMMVRIDPAKSEKVLESSTGAEMMIHGNRVMKGYIFVDVNELHTQKQLQHWIKMALEFNVNAKSSRKK